VIRVNSAFAAPIQSLRPLLLGPYRSFEDTSDSFSRRKLHLHRHANARRALDRNHSEREISTRRIVGALNDYTNRFGNPNIAGLRIIHSVQFRRLADDGAAAISPTFDAMAPLA
jgi:hypothetical protein